MILVYILFILVLEWYVPVQVMLSPVVVLTPSHVVAETVFLKSIKVSCLVSV